MVYCSVIKGYTKLNMEHGGISPSRYKRKFLPIHLDTLPRRNDSSHFDYLLVTEVILALFRNNTQQNGSCNIV